MASPEHHRVKELFLRTCALEPIARAVLLDQECADDPGMRAGVESLLAHHDTQTILPVIPARPAAGLSTGHERLTTASRVLRLVAQEVLEHRQRSVAAVLAVLFLAAGGVWSHHRMQQSLRDILRDEIVAVLNADVTALELWLREQQAEAQRWARQPELREQVAQLAQTARDSQSPRDELMESPVLADLRQTLEPYVRDEGGLGYAIINRSGLVLAARDDADIGNQLNATGMADNAPVLAGETRVVKPHPQGSFVDSRPVNRDIPMIWASTPLSDESGRIVATLNLGVRADQQFTHILSVARMGRSGETYAFDEQGFMLSDSRFTEELKRLEMIPDEPNARAIFNVQVRDPGVDLTRGAKPELPVAARPLTRMAALAVTGTDGVDLDGYRDYRGVNSIGAWRWLPAFGFGVATEVDYGEAYAPLQYPILLSWLPLGLLLAALAGLVYSSYRIVSLRRQVGVARQLGQYTLEEKIGEGGMGVVYRARHALLRRPTAIKLLQPDSTTDLSIARFEREVQLASQLTHPNTIEIYDFGRTPDGIFYYAMEYLPGVSLAQLVNFAGAIPPARAVSILKQVCRSLREAHEQGLVHRDIKPHNIMLCNRGGEDDFVKVLDFGLIKHVDTVDTDNLTAPTVLTGTPLYMAPERLREPARADARSDLYSLGAVGYYLLTGSKIFDCYSDLDVLYSVMNVVPGPPSQSSAEISAELDQLIVSCLAKDPADRPASAAAMLELLERVPGSSSWTNDDARRWWQLNGAALRSAAQVARADTEAAAPIDTVAPIDV